MTVGNTPAPSTATGPALTLTYALSPLPLDRSSATVETVIQWRVIVGNADFHCRDGKNRGRGYSSPVQLQSPQLLSNCQGNRYSIGLKHDELMTLHHPQ
jgi:hypothetical protein